MADAVDPPPVTVTLPDALRRLFQDVPETFETTAESVAGVLDALDARWPGMRGRLADTRPALRRNIVVFVDGERARLDTALEPGSKVVITLAMIG